MNYKFSTGAERIAVIEDLRQPLIVFPEGWDARLTRQRQSRCLSFAGVGCLIRSLIVITCLLDHDPDTRPTALELSQSPLLPARLEDEYFKGALGMMGMSAGECLDLPRPTIL